MLIQKLKIPLKEMNKEMVIDIICSMLNVHFYLKIYPKSILKE